MSTVAAPALETGGGSSTPVSSSSSAPVVSADSVDTLDLTNLDSGTDIEEAYPIPDSMLLGGRRDPDAAEEPAPGKADKADKADKKSPADGRNADGTFAAKKDGDAEASALDATASAPFKYRAMGGTHDLDGATVNAAGDITIPAAKSGFLREALNAHHLASGHFQPVLEQKERTITDLKTRVQDMESSRTASDAKAESLVGLLSKIMENPDDNTALTQLYELKRAWPQLVAKAENEHLRGENERLKNPNARTPATPQPAPDAARGANSNSSTAGMPTADDAKATTREYVEQMKVQHDFRDITPDLWKQIDGEVDRTPFAFLRLATADDARLYGVAVGATVFDTDLLAGHVAAKRTASQHARETAADQTRLAVDNARRTQPSVNAPPTPSGKAGTPAKKRPGITSKQDFNDWLDSDEI